MSIHLFDLMWHDGPLTSVFRKGENLLEIYDWIDQTEKTNIWNVFNVSDVSLLSYVKNEISFTDLIKLGTTFSQVEFDNNLDEVSCKEIKLEDAIPEKDYTFDITISNNEDKIRKFIDEMS